jgi:hypothetical protein
MEDKENDMWKELAINAKAVGTIEVKTTCCENTDKEAINFCYFLAMVVDKYLHSAYSLPICSSHF